MMVQVDILHLSVRMTGNFLIDLDDLLWMMKIDNGFDYQKELHETLKKNFRFDPNK